MLESRWGIAVGIGLSTLTLGLSLSGCGGGGSGGGSAATAPITSATPGPIASAPPQRQAPANLLTGPVVAMVTSASHGFFELPWPLEARRRSNGAPDLTGLPDPRGLAFMRKITDLVHEDCEGFSPTGTIYFQFDGPLLAPPDDPLQSVDPSSAILLVDIDPTSSDRLERQPFHAAITTVARGYRPANLLQLLPVPGVGLKANTTYAAIVLRRLGAPGTAWLGQAPNLTALLAGGAAPGPLGADLARSYAPLLPALLDLGIHPDDVAAATVFTTADPAASLVKQVRHVLTLPPQPLIGPITQRDVWPDFTALKGRWAPPMYQQGVPPFVTGGRQVTDANGLPVAQRTDSAEFQLSIPKGRMPAAGFPLYFYVHGTGGLPNQAIDRGRRTSKTIDPPLGSGLASIVAPVGWATSCPAGHMSPGRIGILSADGYAAYNVLNPNAMRDNFVQMVLEHVHFRNLLLTLRIDPALCPGTDASAAPDGKVHFDPQLLVVGGQSLGSYLSGILAATVPDWKGAILTGAGGSWVEFGFGPKDPIDLTLALEVLFMTPGEKLDRFHPLVMGFDLAGGRADNTHYVRHVLREPLPGHTPPHVLVVEGVDDLQVSANLQRALLLSMGVDLAGGDPAPAGTDERVDTVLPWGGRGEVPYPATLNRVLPSGERRTAIAVRYLPDGIMDGHYVWSQRTEPKTQITQFISDLKAGVAPVVRRP